MARRSDIDWDAIERAFRLGTLSNKQLAEQFGVEPSTIGRREKKHGWVRDKRKDVEVATESLLIQAASGHANSNATPTQNEINVAAQTAANVVLGHRTGLRRLGTLRDRLLGEIEAITDNLPDFQKLGEMLDETDVNSKGVLVVDKLNQIYRRVIDMPDRVDAFKKLVDVDEKVRKGEREAFSIGEQGGASSADDLLDSVAKKMGIA